VNVSRFVKADPEETLNAATEKFISRFAKVEQLALEAGRDMAQMSLEELDRLWEMAKRA
jgi:tetrapyrrole methylase family protein/MazG family protein